MRTLEPIKLVISGDFWDCQIYRGWLYLWQMDGTLLTIDWDALVDSISTDPNDRLVLECALTRSDYFYQGNWSLFFEDPEIKSLLWDKFGRLANRELNLDFKELEKFIYRKQDNPFGELPTDTEIYNNKVFAAIDKGLLQATTHRARSRYPVSSRPKKLLDLSPLSIKASGNKLALAGGNDGLFEFHLDDEYDESSILGKRGKDRPKKVDKLTYRLSQCHSSIANWSFSSIYSSSFIGDSYLGAFDWKKDDEGFTREFKQIVPQSSIFSEPGFSWGLQEKIYKVGSHGLDVVRFVQKGIGEEGGDGNFRKLQSIDLNGFQGGVINGGVALFGTIVECENSLSVLRSDISIFNIQEPVVRWRVYPRSTRYRNHLHVIHEDALEIYSFNHDYFVDQKLKLAGVNYENLSSKNRSNSS